MEAKEWCPQHGYPIPCDKCGLGEYERGLQQGRKEVVDWVERNSVTAPLSKDYPIELVQISDKLWQDFKKEMVL